jgi:hypothetical protein
MEEKTAEEALDRTHGFVIAYDLVWKIEDGRGLVTFDVTHHIFGAEAGIETWSYNELPDHPNPFYATAEGGWPQFEECLEWAQEHFEWSGDRDQWIDFSVKPVDIPENSAVERAYSVHYRDLEPWGNEDTPDLDLEKNRFHINAYMVDLNDIDCVEEDFDNLRMYGYQRFEDDKARALKRAA